MNPYSIATWLRSEESPDVSVICGVAGRFLIALACIVLIAMPWTEYFWRFDKFLRGGQDFELGILALITFLCLVLVLAQRIKRDVTRLLAVRQFFSFFLKEPAGSVHTISNKTLETFHSEPISYPSSTLYALPLKI